MEKFLMLGKYSYEATKGVSAERTQKAVELIENAGGKVKAINILLGNYDMFILSEFPGVKEAINISLALTRMTGISFTTSPALSVEEFDRLIQ